MNRYNRPNIGNIKMPIHSTPVNKNHYSQCEGSPETQVLAMAYVPSQRFENLYSPAEALERGTIFCDLDLPYTGVCRRNVK